MWQLIFTVMMMLSIASMLPPRAPCWRPRSRRRPSNAVGSSTLRVCSGAQLGGLTVQRLYNGSPQPDPSTHIKSRLGTTCPSGVASISLIERRRGPNSSHPRVTIHRSGPRDRRRSGPQGRDRPHGSLGRTWPALTGSRSYDPRAPRRTVARDGPPSEGQQLRNRGNPSPESTVAPSPLVAHCAPPLIAAWAAVALRRDVQALKAAKKAAAAVLSAATESRGKRLHRDSQACPCRAHARVQRMGHVGDTVPYVNQSDATGSKSIEQTSLRGGKSVKNFVKGHRRTSRPPMARLEVTLDRPRMPLTSLVRVAPLDRYTTREQERTTHVALADLKPTEIVGPQQASSLAPAQGKHRVSSPGTAR